MPRLSRIYIYVYIYIGTGLRTKNIYLLCIILGMEHCYYSAVECPPRFAHVCGPSPDFVLTYSSTGLKGEWIGECVCVWLMGGWLGPSVLGGQSIGACGWVSWPIPLANYFCRWRIVFFPLFCSVPPLFIVQIRTKQHYFNGKTHTNRRWCSWANQPTRSEHHRRRRGRVAPSFVRRRQRW